MTVILFGGDDSDLALAVTHYVTKAGNDGTGDGSVGNPWLTIHKALTTVPAGSVIGVGAGVYQETSGGGYLNVTRQFASRTYVRSLTGFAGDVVIMGASDATNNTLIGSGASNIRFRNLTFTMRVGTNAYAVRWANSSNIEFYTCNFQVVSDAGGTRSGIGIQTSGATALSGGVVSGCAFTQNGTNNAYGASLAGWTAGNTIAVTFENCRAHMVHNCLYLNGGDYVVRGGVFHSDAVHAIRFGADSDTGGNATTATVSDIVARSGTGHAFLFGNGVASGRLTNSILIGGDYGVVLKESTGHSVSGCTIYAGTSAGVYFKASNTCSVTGNTIHADQAGAFAVRYARGDTGNRSQGCTFTGNTIHLSEQARLYDFAPNGIALDDTGGTTVFNSQSVNISSNVAGPYGTINAVTGITTKSNALTQWAGYGGGTNDNASKFGGVNYA